MLEELNVKNFALIDDITVSFSDGFNVLSGETGAGKSILVGALGILLGKKADTSLIRIGCLEANISGIINIHDHREIPQWLEKHGISDEDGSLIIRRTIKKTGRGSIYVQSIPVLRSDLAELTALLFDMHSQHEHQSLFIVDNHRKLLDRFGGLEKEALDFYNLFHSLSVMRKELNSLLESEDDHKLMVEKLKSEILEINEAQLFPGEEETIEKDINILARREEIFISLDGFRDLVSESRGGSLSKLRKAGAMLDNITDIDDSLNPLQKKFENMFLELEDMVETLRSYQSEFESDPSELNIKEDRLALISDLEKKYGLTIEDVLKYAEENKKSLTELEDDEFNIEEMKKKISQISDKVKNTADLLSEKRSKSALELQLRIEENLHELGMNSAKFIVDLNRKKSIEGQSVYGAWGMDSIEFLLSANSGEPEKPLKSVASGGEISRVMLALKTVLSDSDDVSSLVFDEIDSGIGGEVALSVGAHMRDLARYKQVLSITHLASIAVFADNHIIVKKNIVEDRTVTSVYNIDKEERTKEIARMLSGDSDRSASISHAEEMLRTYGSI